VHIFVCKNVHRFFNFFYMDINNIHVCKNVHRFFNLFYMDINNIHVFDHLSFFALPDEPFIDKSHWFCQRCYLMD
jgi:hypothetical protein